MAKVSYYLDNKINREGENLIFLSFSYTGSRLRYSTGQAITRKNWSIEENRARRSFSGYKSLNDLLDKLQTVIKDIHRKAQTDQNLIDNHFLKLELDKFLLKVNSNGVTPSKKSLECYYEEYLAEKGRVGANQLNPVSLLKYRNILNIMKRFTLTYKIPLSYNAMTQEYYNSYLEYRANDYRSNETVSKELTSWKSFLIWSFKKKYCPNNDFVDIFKGFDSEKPVIAMTNDELFQLYNFDFRVESRDWKAYLKGMKDKEGKQIIFCESWEDIKFIFFFCSVTSLRYSDYLQLTKANIQGDYIVMTLQKTSDPIRIVINKYAREVLEKYNYQLPKFSNPYCNRELKNLGQAAGLTQKRVVTKFVGQQRFDETVHMYQILKFHTARKNFVTLSLEKGMRPEVVMKQTGHKKYATMIKYLAFNDKAVKEESLSAWNK